MTIGDPHTAEQLQAEVSRRLKHALPVELVRHLCPQVRDDVRTICAYCFRNGFRNLRVTQVGDWWRHNPRTVNRHLHNAELRSLEYVIDSARLLHAAYLLDDMRAELAVLATVLDYPSSSAFANDVRRWTGYSPSALQQRGAIDTVVPLIRSCIQSPR